MIDLDRVSRRILGGIWNPFRIVERIGRSRSDARSHDKGFDVESADEFPVAKAIFIGLNVALVPGQAKRRPIRHLDDKQVKVGVGWQSPHFDFHDFNRADRFNFNLAVRIRRNAGKRFQPARADEIEMEIVTIVIVIEGVRRRGEQCGWPPWQLAP